MQTRLLAAIVASFFVTSTLAAQLSVDRAPDALLPIDPPRYFVSQNTERPTLKSLMLDNASADETAPPSLTALKYQPHLAFFCRVEVKIDKAVGTPFRFRLGSVDYVDYLEGKRRHY